ncbi:ABC transporter ATP-binding protein [Plasticicumulans acidivorans]|uniref:Nucleoside ABC transporter ATP-binding protein n=1 Tax=Plasticicumulans acidivorans TaxID=886464 RepID=A0A317MWA8_9GAMM|nr:ABC transporter ATP-binding protein [Plasticicumulans acidivorans]PWV63111.1 nucleoside ABC transporter ATP-binding protein [Plasticicumulans acidivorans]
MTATGAPVLRLRGIGKRFGPVIANADISLELARGEVLALLGENGAGKSTLVSILFGHYRADSGSIEAFGQPLPPGDPAAALAAGIGMVHQHFTLADNLTVLENILIGTEPLWQPFSRRRAALARIHDTAARFGLAVDPAARVARLSVGEKQRVEILKALYRGARVLILDEPTAVLTPQESSALFATLKELVAEGLSIIFISHKLDEVLAVSDRVAVLRGGRLVAERAVAETSKAELATLMVGREVKLPQRALSVPGPLRLRLRGVRVDGHGAQPRLDGVDLEVHGGEIVAIAGVSGNGQAALAELLCGLCAASAGRVELDGRPLPADPAALLALGVGRIPEDRTGIGTIGDLPVWQNAILERWRSPRFSRWGLLRRGAARAFTQQLVAAGDVRLGSIEQPARGLSGGNLQKLVLGRALDGEPGLIIAQQPSWGLDIGAVAAVHERLLAARARGAALLLISEDLDEVFALADRIAVMSHGQLGPARPGAEWTLASLGLAMAGARHDAA